jgi:hypothetical protein
LAAFYIGEHQLEEWSELEDNDVITISHPLREALIKGSGLRTALKDAEKTARTKKVNIAYLDKVTDLLKVLHSKTDEGEDWRDVLQSKDSVRQGKLAAELQPIIQSLSKKFAGPLSFWNTLISDLKASHTSKMQKEKEKNLKQTKKLCHRAELDHCAIGVKMEMGGDVDYVKVEYQRQGEDFTKLKFFSTGNIVQTRGEKPTIPDLKEKMETGALLPGDDELTITFCKNLQTVEEPDTTTRFFNFFSWSKSRCQQVGTSLIIKLSEIPDEAVDSEEGLAERQRMRLPLSRDPRIAFLIWDGDYHLKRSTNV